MKFVFKQPNGFYAIFSSICDNLVAFNCTEDDIIRSLFVEYDCGLDTITRMLQEAEDDMSVTKVNVKEYEGYRYQYALDTIESAHSKERKDYYIKRLSKPLEEDKS
jgi:hypothetical protein